MCCLEYDTANYCPVPLPKISIRKYGTDALTHCPHSPQYKAKNFNQNCANQLCKNLKIRLYFKSFISLLAMSVAKRWRHVTRLHRGWHRAGGGRCPSITRRAKIKWERLSETGHVWTTEPFPGQRQSSVWRDPERHRQLRSLAISHHFPNPKNTDHIRSWSRMMGWSQTGYQGEKKKEEKSKKKNAHLYCNHGYNSGLILNFA